MERLKNILYYLRTGGLSEQEINICMPEVKKRTVDTLRWLMAVMTCAMLIMTVVSYIPGSGEESNRTIYALFSAILCVEYVINRVYFEKHPEHVLGLMYVFMMTFYVFGMYEAVMLGDDSTDTAFCVGLVAVPLMVYDLPARLALMTIVAEGSMLGLFFKFGIADGSTKFLVINSFASMVIGIFCGYVIQRSKFNEVKNHLLLQTQRDTDVMTGVRSRTAYSRYLGEVSSGSGVTAGVIFCDVNGLKRINDSEGHEAGDRLIKNACDIMFRHFGELGDRIYRIGGDEFVIISSGEDSKKFDKRVEAMCAEGGRSEILSVGSIWEKKITNMEEAVNAAEKMMYKDKARYYAAHPEYDRRLKRIEKEKKAAEEAMRRQRIGEELYAEV